MASIFSWPQTAEMTSNIGVQFPSCETLVPATKPAESSPCGPEHKSTSEVKLTGTGVRWRSITLLVETWSGHLLPLLEKNALQHQLLDCTHNFRGVPVQKKIHHQFLKQMNWNSGDLAFHVPSPSALASKWGLQLLCVGPWRKSFVNGQGKRVGAGYPFSGLRTSGVDQWGQREILTPVWHKGRAETAPL